jgi:hypothetical protein
MRFAIRRPSRPPLLLAAVPRRRHRAREHDARRARLGVIAPAAPTEASLIATIARAAKDDWRAAAWLVRYFDSRPTVEEPVGVTPSPFAEVDELAAKRRSRPGAWPSCSYDRKRVEWRHVGPKASTASHRSRVRRALPAT